MVKTRNPKNIATRVSVVVKPIFPSSGPVACKKAMDMTDNAIPAPAMIPFIKEDFESIKNYFLFFDLKEFTKIKPNSDCKVN